MPENELPEQVDPVVVASTDETETGPAPEAAAAPQPSIAEVPKPRSRKGMFFFGALSGCLLVAAGVVILGFLVLIAGDGASDLSLATNKIAIIPIEGEIFDARDTIEEIEKHADSPTVKAIVVRINSPGGAIAPSQEIYSTIRRVRADSGKPIVASLDSVAASGGFYIAAACDQIVANPGSITGSIGVILQWFELKDLLQWAKMEANTITSGAMKDAGSPFRELSEQERAYFQRIVAQLHLQFVRDVADGRREKMKYEEVARIADGRIMTGEEALSLKLVDQLGGMDEAVRTAAKLAGIKGEPALIWPRRRAPGLFDLLTQGRTASAAEKLMNRRIPQFLYRW